MIREPLYNIPSLRHSEEILWHMKKMDISYTHVKSSWKAEETKKYTFFAKQETNQKVANPAICPMDILQASTNEQNYHIWKRNKFFFFFSSFLENRLFIKNLYLLKKLTYVLWWWLTRLFSPFFPPLSLYLQP